MEPGEERTLTVCSNPATKWQERVSVSLIVEPPTLDVAVEETITDAGARYIVRAQKHPEIDPEDYPIRTTLHVYTAFKGHAEPRHLQSRDNRERRTAPPPPPPVTLLDEPTFLRVSSRQPVKLRTDDGDTHVRLVWNGRNDLVTGTPAEWVFGAHCLTPSGVNTHTAFSMPRDGGSPSSWLRQLEQ